ncbi:MAG: Glutathione import ATP-binding protein GsiA [Alphaproteobacteria bacterium MarineAlpha3_Bin5]|nr:MAG: Glutathione import ATP-binding protein GsiA [Alphaproteobacteria bacterium MarineAlpha3_Bin5]
MQDLLIEVENLHITFPTAGQSVEAVRGVTFHIEKGKTLGVVGESGSGKSVTSMSLLRLNDIAGAYMPQGTIHLNSERLGRIEITRAKDSTMNSIRGREISMIFQEPMTCLNPVLNIRTQLTEHLFEHLNFSYEEAEKKVLDLLRRVRIPDPESKLGQYPHNLSGGMRQRVMIAMALACGPSLLIADEPTTALDVTIQAQILDLIKDVQEEFGMSILFITHDMAVIAEMADEVIVMFDGKIVETGSVHRIFHDPQHDYTKKLINAVPRIGSMEGKSMPEKFPEIIS